MMSHSKLPWAITATPKGSKQITDARGGVVANLTALDIANAELIVSSVNKSEAIIEYITDPSKLEVDRRYWLVSKLTLSGSEIVKIEICKERDGYIYFRDYLWAHTGNNQVMAHYDIFGPIPEQIFPDFDALRALAVTKK